MMQFDSLRGITRRELRINYRSPLICQPGPSESGSGSSTSIPAFLPILTIDGPVGLLALVSDCPRVVTLTWTPLAGAIGYNVFVSDSEDGPFVYVQSVDDPVFMEEVVADTIYFYQVSAFGDFGVSNPSAVLSVNVPACE
jgi:hypothetical protein